MMIKFITNLWIFITFLSLFVTSMNIINFIDIPNHVIIPKDSYSRIKCHINIPNAKYTWLYLNEHGNMEQQVAQNQYISFDKDGILVLQHHSSTAGRYRCRVIVPDIGVALSSLVQVDIAEVFIHKLFLPSLGRGSYKSRDKAILICPFSAMPQSEVEYKWVLRAAETRKPISPSKYTVFHQNGRILEVDIDKFAFGTYICTALYAKYGFEKHSPDIDVLPYNEHGIGSSELEPLKFIAKPLEALFLDNKDQYDKHVKTSNGQRTLINKEGTTRLELICAANSNDSSEVEILWFKDNVRIDRAAIQYDRFNYEITGQGTLVLINTTRMYNGLYKCQASLKRNSSIVINYSFKLDIKPMLRFFNKPPPIVMGDRNEEILLICRINDADSQSKIVWKKNGELISGNSYLQQNEGFLRISKLLESDEGIFQCLADNEFSSIQATTQLKIRKRKLDFLDNRPSLVKNLRVKAVSFRTLNISWNPAPNGFETILHYEIILFDLSNLSVGNSKITIKADRLESSVLVKDLAPDSFYKIFLYAVNGSGKSFPAIINSTPRVLSRAPSAPPTRIRISEIGSSVATVSWLPPPNNYMNGELIGYRVIVVSSDSLYSKTLDISPVSNVQLSDLTQETKYAVQIQASTRGGRGPLSTAVYFETKLNVNDNDESYNRMHRKGLQTSKKKLYYPSGGEESKKQGKQNELPSQIISWRAKGLNTSIALQWSHPVNGGPVTKYTIKWGKVYPGPSSMTLHYPTSAYVIDNLEFRTQYMIKIIPSNDNGDGKELLFSSMTGSPDIRRIPIPLNLGISKVGMTWAILSWEDPSNDLSNTRLYQIRYSSLDKDFQSTDVKNATENKVQITGLRSSTSYSFSVRTGDVTPPREGDYISKDWTWSEWSLKESFNTMGEKPTVSPQEFKLVTVGIPDVRNNDVYSRVAVTWSSPYKNSTKRNDELIRYTIYFTADPKLDISTWHTQVLPSDQVSSEINLSGVQKIYYFRVGCQTKNFECPLSPILLYKTSDAQKQNYGLLRVPEKYRYSVDIPVKYLNAKPVQTLDIPNEEPLTATKDILVIVSSIAFGVIVLVIVLMIVIFAVCHKKSRSSFTGYKLGTKSSMQHMGGAGLLLSNQSPAMSNGKVSPHFVGNFNQSLKTPDLFPHPEPHFADLESDSNQDNDSLRFASVSQHHLASTAGVTNMFNPTIQNHSLIRSHPQMVSYYSDMPIHSKSSINSSTILNPLINNSISIPIQIQGTPALSRNTQYHQSFTDSSLGRAQLQNPVYSYQGHPFTQHLLSAGVGMPICSSSCLQPIHMSPQMIGTPPHDVQTPVNFTNTPRVNASELASHTSSEDIRPTLNGSRISESDMSQYYGSAGANSTGKSHKTNVSKKSHIEPLRNNDVIKSANHLDNHHHQSENEVAKGFSTEELSQEMANLEGLMKDLNAITQKEFEC